jgi:hypothetical protein
MNEAAKKNEALTTADLAAAATDQRPAEASGPAGAKMVREDRATTLFSEDEAQNLRSSWDGIQAAFVDEPRRAVEQADELVATAIKRLAEVFAEERSKLEHQWDRGGDVSTEDLRVTLQRYRSFFSRLLAV